MSFYPFTVTFHTSQFHPTSHIDMQTSMQTCVLACVMQASVEQAGGSAVEQRVRPGGARAEAARRGEGRLAARA